MSFCLNQCSFRSFLRAFRNWRGSTQEAQSCNPGGFDWDCAFWANYRERACPEPTNRPWHSRLDWHCFSCSAWPYRTWSTTCRGPLFFWGNYQLQIYGFLDTLGSSPPSPTSCWSRCSFGSAVSAISVDTFSRSESCTGSKSSKAKSCCFSQIPKPT